MSYSQMICLVYMLEDRKDEAGKFTKIVARNQKADVVLSLFYGRKAIAPKGKKRRVEKFLPVGQTWHL